MSLITAVEDGVAILTLDRPEVRNAFDDALILALTRAYDAATINPDVYAVLLRANGPIFCAGGDLNWMRRMAAYSRHENLADAMALASLMRTIDLCPKPTLVRVHGSAFAGATGLIAASDIVVAVPEAEFAVTEVRIGLIPSVISPYLVRAMGARQARRYFLTAERFSAATALALGLVHEVVPAEELDAAIARHLKALKAASPGAMAATKALVAAVDRPFDQTVMQDTARRIADQRASADGREGVSAFLEKRKPTWGAA
ncbi:enoyl-CoA hydratase/isomerase family protein [Xanthobacter autotrophicus]|uniref:enoyl-CoA hydratase/isomerase family protein n=1 Tax=Xanthobacter autotrophicus TaxID=280 RepID=UPI0024A6E0DE|nr:enoyl-CoA hydratase/isomerase family protein [Xanthobacter autotrophicus]MDI4658399.1 enoyl-CoA hydratase/isomerase family protein [Xanthobacter autotrophicus]